MPSLGSVDPVKRLACPHCHSLLSEEVVELALEGEDVPCPDCGGIVRLPAEVVERHQRSKYLGTSLDITC